MNQAYISLQLDTTITHAPVTSRLDYCYVLYVAAFEHCLETSVGPACRSKAAGGCFWAKHITPVLRHVHRLSICFQAASKYWL